MSNIYVLHLSTDCVQLLYFKCTECKSMLLYKQKIIIIHLILKLLGKSFVNIIIKT